MSNAWYNIQRKQTTIITEPKRSTLLPVPPTWIKLDLCQLTWREVDPSLGRHLLSPDVNEGRPVERPLAAEREHYGASVLTHDVVRLLQFHYGPLNIEPAAVGRVVLLLEYTLNKQER